MFHELTVPYSVLVHCLKKKLEGNSCSVDSAGLSAVRATSAPSHSLGRQKTALGSVILMHLEVLSSFDVQVLVSAWVVTWHAQSLTLAE